MTDNPAMRAAHRAAALAGRKAAEAVGARPTRVQIRVREYSAAINATGTELALVYDTEVTPRPKVRQLSAGDASFYGGGPAAGTGSAGARVYTIGPITLPTAGAGWSIATLQPEESETTRVTIVLTGDDFDADGEEFDLAAPPDASRPHQVTLIVSRTKQGA